MASSVSDEDLEKKRVEADKLREQILAAQSDLATKQASAQNEIVATQLDAEITNLKAQLAAVKGDASVAAVKAAASGPLAQAKDQLAQSVAVAEAPSPLDRVDTTVETDNKEGDN